MSPPWGKQKDKILLPKGNVGSTYSNAKDKFFLKEKKKKVKERKKLGQGFRVFTIIGKPKAGPTLGSPHNRGAHFGLVWFGLVSKRGDRSGTHKWLVPFARPNNTRKA